MYFAFLKLYDYVFLKDFLEFYNKSCAEDSISKPLQMLFVGAGNIDRWASATASMLKAKDDRFSAIEYYLRNRLSHAHQGIHFPVKHLFV